MIVIEQGRSFIARAESVGGGAILFEFIAIHPWPWGGGRVRRWLRRSLGLCEDWHVHRVILTRSGLEKAVALLPERTGG